MAWSRLMWQLLLSRGVDKLEKKKKNCPAPFCVETVVFQVILHQWIIHYSLHFGFGFFYYYLISHYQVLWFKMAQNAYEGQREQESDRMKEGERGEGGGEKTSWNVWVRNHLKLDPLYRNHCGRSDSSLFIWWSERWLFWSSLAKGRPIKVLSGWWGDSRLSPLVRRSNSSYQQISQKYPGLTIEL